MARLATAAALSLLAALGTANAQTTSTGSGQAASTSSGQAASTNSGQAYPIKPIRLVAPFAPGGSTLSFAAKWING